MSKILPTHRRTRFTAGCLYCFFLIIIVRLFYWQVINHSVLRAEAEDQYTRVVSAAGHRGRIFTADGAVLVDNQTVFRVLLQREEMRDTANHLAEVLAPVFAKDDGVATDAASLELETATWQRGLTEKMLQPSANWISLKGKISAQTRDYIESLKIEGVHFDSYEARSYPEASMAAHLTGFVGKDVNGEDRGYFGVEGALDRELRGQKRETTFLKDALGLSLLFDGVAKEPVSEGRDVTLTIRRDVQHAVEQLLAEGVEKYGAVAGEVVVLEPSSGKILASAAWPSYDQAHFSAYDPALYKNPVLTHTYEPGSIFKIITMAGAIDAGAVQPETTCPICSTARTIGEYTIRTWNDVYRPNISMTEALTESDNTAMIFASEQLGKDRFVEYIDRFGIGDESLLDLQEDTGTPLRTEWKTIDLATASFGQGIVTNSIQMVRAIATVANQGVMMRPRIIEKVSDEQRSDVVGNSVERQVISADAAQKITKMMVNTAENGEAKWTKSKSHLVAAKTGTAQIPIAGHYDPTKTIASFIGFAPPDNPRFVMIVKLQEPATSPWAAETAAPVWYSIAERLFLLLNIPPDKLNSARYIPEWEGNREGRTINED